jgi:localization factor PodJL
MTDHIAWGVKEIDPAADEAAQTAGRKAGGTLARWLNGTTSESPRTGGVHGIEPAARGDGADEPFTRVADRLSRMSRTTTATSLPAQSLETGPERGSEVGATRVADGGETDDIFTRVANRLAKRAASPSRPAPPHPGSPDRTTPDGGGEARAGAVLDALALRLDVIETKLDSGRVAEPLTSAIEKIEERMEALTAALARSPGTAPAEDMLRKLESRLAEIMLRLNQDTSSPAAPLDPDHTDERGQTTTGAAKQASLHEPLKRRTDPPVQASAARGPEADTEAVTGEPTERDRFAAALAEIRARQVRLREETERESRTKASAKQESPPATTDTPPRSAELSGAPSGDDLTGRLDALARQIEATLASGNFPMAEIIQRLEQIDARIEHPQQRIHLNRVKDLLQAVAARLEADERNRLSPEALDALEDQLEHLARRVDEALRTRPGDGAIDKKLGELENTILDLITQVQTFQGSAARSVEEAARAGVADALARLWDDLPPEIGSLKADLTELRSVYDQTEQRSHDTLTAVHGALEKVVERLTLLEGELQAARAPEPSPQPFARPPGAPSRADSVSARDRIFDPRIDGKDLDAPLEAAPRAADRDRPVPAGGADVKASFIAAARRAARAATEETATGPAARPPEATAAIARGRGASLIERLRQAPSRRRHLLLGLAALVVAVGATQLILGMPRGPKPDLLFATPAKPALDSDDATGMNVAGADKPADSAVANPFAADPNDAAVTGSIKPQPDASPSAKAATTDVAPAEEGPAIVTPVPAQLLASVPATVEAPALRAAAERGDAAAVYELAARLAEGRGMTRDPQLAAQLFEAQAEAGFVPAEYRLASHYEKGFGVDRDLGKAQSWYLKAAEKGNAKAMHNLAVLYAEGVGGKPDYTAAAEWFRKAAEFGVHDSQFNLAILAARGLGMQVDLVQAYTWFTILANSGDQDAAGKRDSIGARLSPTDLATARAAAERWQPKTPDPAANTVETPASWGPTTSGDAKAAGSSKSRA